MIESWAGSRSLARSKKTYVIIQKVDKPRGMFSNIHRKNLFNGTACFNYWTNSLPRDDQCLTVYLKWNSIFNSIFQNAIWICYRCSCYRVTDVLKNLRDKKEISIEQYKDLSPLGPRTGIMYGLAKVHKIVTDGLPSFRPILSVISTPTYKLAKFLVPMLEFLTANKYTIKDPFRFTEELQSFDSKLVMANFDIESLFTNILL